VAQYLQASIFPSRNSEALPARIAATVEVIFRVTNSYPRRGDS
jgi:hypothetical protein